MDPQAAQPIQQRKPIPQLLDYVAKARAAQMTDGEINAELLKAGWPPLDVQTALRPPAATVEVPGAKAEEEKKPSKLFRLGGMAFGAVVVLAAIYLALAYWVLHMWPFAA